MTVVHGSAFSANKTRASEPTIGVEMVMTGDNACIEVRHDKAIALDPGSHFAISEEGEPIISGVVSEVMALLPPGG